MLGLLEDTQEMVKSKTVRQLVYAYLNSNKFRKLGRASEIDYYDCLSIIEKDLGHLSLKRLTVPVLQYHYDKWLNRGIPRANKIISIMSVLINWGIKNNLKIENLIKHMDKMPNPPRKVKWEPNQVKLFLDTAYSEWKWRSVGLIVHMAYEWGQRVGDMRMLLWNAIDLDKGRCDFEQSKRGEAVHLPISDGLMHVLRQQHETFSFQVLVAPQIQPSDGAYKPYSKGGLYVHVNAILKEAGLPSHLTAMDMRRTAITEMVEAGVDITQIKQVSGHTSINSLTPYIKHTYTGASEALAQRNAYKDNSDG
jgi:integrase